jgi:hypothetical protein
MFHPPRNRDARASIRGYVYQIDRTVEQWLVLAPGHALELERGEDIDVVGRLIASDGDASVEARLLEQVKHREMGITLRTPAALEALANFHSHRQAAPRCDLRFRFLTNTTPGAEQFSPFPNRVPGITLWEQVRTRSLDESAVQEAADRLRSFLTNSQRPDGLDEAVWGDWKAYLARVSPKGFREFIDRFEWSTAHPDSKELPLAIRGQIQFLRLAADETEAQAVADRLFVHVARLLGNAGVKRLTAEGRDTLLSAPALSVADRGLLKALRTIVDEHADRLDELEANVTDIGGKVEALFLSSTSGERVELALPVTDLTLPQPVARLSRRSQTAERLRHQMRECGWLALRGGPDTGKSQLALQLALGHGACRGWVRLHHALPGPAAARHLDAALAAMGGQAPQSGSGTRADGPLATLGAGSLIVLDDVPRLAGDDPLAERLARLGLDAQAARVQIVSTSQFEFPARLRGQFGSGWMWDQPAPPFTDAEAGDLLRAHGASEAFLTAQRLTFLNRLATGHPLLLAAVAEFLARRGWSCREEEIDGLLRGDHAEAILPEVVERLTRT